MTTPKKSLGQNWLNSQAAINKIITAANLSSNEIVLEVGPGKGALTKALLATGAKVVAIEKDHRLIDELENLFATEITEGQLTLVEKDILEIPIEELGSLMGEMYKVVANIPYYITGELIRFFLELPHQPTDMVLLVQKEVAERIVGINPKASKEARVKESILSLSVKAYGTPKLIAKVPAGSFTPAPKVDSAILSISNINRYNFQDISEKNFFAIVKQGFSQKRKLLRSNLQTTEQMLHECNIEPNTRAEDVSLAEWLCLAKHYHVS